jgi:hypothetical protein
MENYSIEPYDQDKVSKDFRKEDAYMRAKKRVESLKGFYWHLAVYIVVNAFLIIFIGYNSGGRYFSFGAWSTAIFWGIGLLFHFLGVFGPDFIFGKDWEKRKIEEFMKKEEDNWKSGN